MGGEDDKNTLETGGEDDKNTLVSSVLFPVQPFPQFLTGYEAGPQLDHLRRGVTNVAKRGDLRLECEGT